MNKLITTIFTLIFSYTCLMACDTSGATLTSVTSLSATSKRVTIDLDVAFGSNGSNGNTDFIGIAFPDGYGINITNVTPNSLTSSAVDGCVDVACTTLNVTGSGRTIEIKQGFADLLNDYNGLGVAGEETYTLTVDFSHTSDPSGTMIYVVGMEGYDPDGFFDSQNDQLFLTFPDDIHTNIDPSPAVGFSNCGGGACSYHCTYAMMLPVSLPVELLEFQGKTENEYVLLNWKTATELQNEKFIIEKSTDGYRFDEIGEVSGQGNSVEEKEYNYIDRKPATGMNYYRLKQVDFDGSYAYTDIIKVSYYENGFIANISPNPIKLNMVLNIESNNASGFHINVYDMNGRTVVSFEEQMNTGSNTLEYNMEDLERGIYLVTIHDGLNYHSQKVLLD